ncbi:redoxin domain-containing protein [Solidesulfovibrio aerotolerans]|uniref:redoxin domain-containing protein n=1 Tax=Solidesulfovibrio aerotolerans TaxID=295255 RepID=UPI0031B585F6
MPNHDTPLRRCGTALLLAALLLAAPVATPAAAPTQGADNAAPSPTAAPAPAPAGTPTPGAEAAKQSPAAHAAAPSLAGNIYPVPHLPPNDSVLAVAVGSPMPDFDLPTIDGSRVRLADFIGQKNLVISFVPAAWTPVCSGQWPGYNIAQDIFEGYNTALLGVTVDNIPTLHAWTREMGGLWFPVASDFWPHGGLAQKLGILRSDGTAERALLLVDKHGIIRFIDVHDINVRPDLGPLIEAMKNVHKDQ